MSSMPMKPFTKMKNAIKRTADMIENDIYKFLSA